MMHGHEKSDSAIVAMKPPNKAGRPAAEAVERRAEAKENANRCHTCRTQCRESVSPTPERVRKAEASRQTSEVGAVCRKAARTVLCGGRPVMGVPTAIRRTQFRIEPILKALYETTHHYACRRLNRRFPQPEFSR